jgi:putative alpha-1,2-mannosidase
MRILRNEARIQLIIILLLIPLFLCKADNSMFVDPAIGGISKLLKPTYPTYHLPNQMIRMFPISNDYIDDQISAFPLQVVSHRSSGIMQMRLGTGPLTPDSWTRSMTYDHDLEVRHPWLYSTYFPEEEITVSFAPGEKCAMYKIQFPHDKQKFLLFKGTTNFQPKVLNNNTFTLKQKIHYTQRGINPDTRVMAVYAYAELTQQDGTPIQNADLTTTSNQINILLNPEAASAVLLKYGISYISYEQAKSNFENEVSSVVCCKYPDTIADEDRIS